jgi:hypothetical protein
MEKPTIEHLVAVKRILRYIAGTVNFGCSYQRKRGEVCLTGFSDSDHGADIDGRKSTTGVLFFPWREPDHLAVTEAKGRSLVKL